MTIRKIQLFTLALFVIPILIFFLDKPKPSYPCIEPSAIFEFKMDDEDIQSEIRHGLCIDYEANFQEELRQPDSLPIHLTMGSLSDIYRLWKIELVTAVGRRTIPKLSLKFYQSPTNEIRQKFHNCKENHDQYLMVYIVPKIKLTDEQKQKSLHSIKNCTGPIYFKENW